MVALVATTLEAAIKDWRSGSYVNTDFNAGRVIETYLTHIQNLLNIQEKNPSGYHFIMTTLYDLASSGQKFSALKASAEDMMEDLDLQGMPEDSEEASEEIEVEVRKKKEKEREVRGEEAEEEIFGGEIDYGSEEESEN
ncbi:unnamed protein product [Somion occarium]|uniref:DUF6532 domain-containing protein n=1 Tax=Somion occarium TaxID=3059160 RepID=A0ABP1DZ93_9APHY